jgi:hypothetical protein
MRFACSTTFVLLSALAAAGCQRNDAAPGPSASAGTASTAGAHPASATPTLAKGDAAPPFSLPGSDGKTHALADHAGKQAVVLAWFPKAFTGG